VPALAFQSRQANLAVRYYTFHRAQAAVRELGDVAHSLVANVFSPWKAFLEICAIGA